MHLLKVLITLLVCSISFQVSAQVIDSVQRRNDTANSSVRNIRPPASSQQPNRPAASAQATDSGLRSTGRSQDSPVRRTPTDLRRSAPPGQVPADTIRIIRDTARENRAIRARIEQVMQVLRQHPFLHFFGEAQRRQIDERQQEDKDLLFYFLCTIVLYFAILKLAFAKYLANLFTLFFRVTMRQQQIREQLLQAPLPSLLLNFLFAISGGMYLNLVLHHYNLEPSQNFWISFSYCVALISLLYIGKLLILKTMGWIFNVSNATNTYLFIVFLVNKMIGMFLLPFLFILAFPHPAIYSGMLTLSFILVIALFIYRFIITYRPLRTEINVGQLHFLIYLCAFEIAPLLLIYKVLFNFVERNN